MGGDYFMIMKRCTKNRLFKAIFGCLFGIIGLFSLSAPVDMAYAEPVNETNTTVVTDTTEPNVVENNDNPDETTTETETQEKPTGEASCKDSLGALGWLVCPTTGKIAEAVDWLYDKIEGVLVINPVEAKNGSPIYEIWKYMKGITNIVFVIFLLVVIYSQITGVGISNYGIKRALPKLIIAAILVNLSFIICSLAVDVSNIVGSSLRGVFTSIEESTLGSASISGASMSEMYIALGGGTALAVGAAVIAFETGAIWMLIPTILGAIVAVVIGLITISLRQAVVALLVMISPLAMVAYILPNTEQWFKKWKDLLVRMLVFYPMFSLLFGASSLAGYAIIASATDGFGVLLGIMVQIFPLFFSWKLMKMSGTVLGTVNTALTNLTAKPIAANRSWAESHRELSRAKHLAAGKAYTPSLRLMQFMSNRKIAREEDTKEHLETAKNRGLAYSAARHYTYKNGKEVVTREGEEAYEAQMRNMQYQRTILRHKNNFNNGLGNMAANKKQEARLNALDRQTIDASDFLKTEQARGEKIDYNNAVYFHKRMEDAMNAHFDAENAGNDKYRVHDIVDREWATARYSEMSKIMDGNKVDIDYAAATAAHAYDTQNKMLQTKMQKWLDLTPPTRDLEKRLEELTTAKDALDNIDAIIAGLRVLNQRGDTDLVSGQVRNLLDRGVELGTHASQSLASFLMFDVADNDPFLKRFGKYINLETANVYNENKRKKGVVTLDEYVTGEHVEPDGKIMYAKRPMKVLLEGTSLDKIERTAMKDLDDILKYVYTTDNKLDVKAYLDKREEMETAIGPQFISASLKYLSGSEQLKSAVSFITGYTLSQMKDEDGNVMTDKDGNVIYDYTARWDKGGDLAGDAKYAEKYFREKTEKYFKDQTPTQILGLRTDYREPVVRHLLASLFDENSDLKREYEAEMSDIQTRYGDLDKDKAAEKRKMDEKELRMKYTGQKLRQILDKSGKLEQIYRTRRSGAANNAKDWLRDWLLLNDEAEIYRYLDAKQQQRKEAHGDDGSDSPADVVYGEAERAELVNALDDLFEKSRDVDDETFYERSRDFLISNLSKDHLITEMYDDYRKQNKYSDKNDLCDFLHQMLENPDNYK